MKKIIIVLFTLLLFVGCDMTVGTYTLPDYRIKYNISDENKKLLEEIFDNKIEINAIFVEDIKEIWGQNWWAYYQRVNDSIYIDIHYTERSEYEIKKILMHEYFHKYEFHMTGDTDETYSYYLSYLMYYWNESDDTLVMRTSMWEYEKYGNITIGNLKKQWYKIREAYEK